MVVYVVIGWSTPFIFVLSVTHSGLPTLMSWGCSSCGMATSSRSALQSSAAAPSLTLPFTASATSLAPENSEWIFVSYDVLWLVNLFWFKVFIVHHPQVSSEPGRKGAHYPNLHLGKIFLWWWEEVHRLCLSCNPQELSRHLLNKKQFTELSACLSLN